MSFNDDLSAFQRKYKRNADLIVSKILIDLATRLVEKSPVGDANYWVSPAPPGYVGGRFRANWQYGAGAADTDTSEKTDSSGASTVSVIVGKVGSEPGGKIHYITNSLPYAKRLEGGWSKRQAPFGMVALTVQEFRPIVAAAARAINK